MRIYPGLEMIDVPFERGRQVNVWLLAGERRLLADTGVAGSARETIVPRLESLGIPVSSLDLVINLHAHADHIGGNGELLAAAAHELAFGAHALDALAIEDHHYLATHVYGLSDPERVDTLMSRCGAEVPVRHRFSGGEELDLGGRLVRVLHLPGHTEGNIALYDPAERALIHGESIMGGPVADSDGSLSAPFGADPLVYQQALQALRGLEVRLLLSSHRPPADGVFCQSLVEESLAAVERFTDACRTALQQSPGPAGSIARSVSAEVGYRFSPRLETQVTQVLAHWVAQGEAVQGPDGRIALN